MSETAESGPSGAPDRADQSGEARTSSAGPTAQASSDPGTPTNPDQVPIGNHLHWLMVAGVLWGAWRLAQGG